MNRRSFIRRAAGAVTVAAAPIIPVGQSIAAQWSKIPAESVYTNPLWSGRYPDWDGMSLYRWDEENRSGENVRS